MDLNVETWHAWRNLQDLIRFRRNGRILEAAADWLDKEISDIQSYLEVDNDG